MPVTKEYKGKKNHGTHKRRPRHELHEERNEERNDEVVDAVESEETVYDAADEVNTEALNEGVTSEEPTPHFFHEEEPKEEKIHLEFYGSDVIRTKAPHIMELADTVADEWVKDGQFQGLPVGNPIAQLAAAKALRTAKDVEKKLEEKGVFVMAKMGLDYLKSKIDRK